MAASFISSSFASEALIPCSNLLPSELMTVAICWARCFGLEKTEVLHTASITVEPLRIGNLPQPLRDGDGKAVPRSVQVDGTRIRRQTIGLI